MDSLSFEEVKVKWDVIFKDPLLSLSSLREKGYNGNICSQGLRSICWKLYLAYLPSLDTATWSLTLNKERQHYADLRQKYITSPATDNESDSNATDLSINNPLSLDQANPWQEYFKDTELRKIIKQDVERTFPENEYFRSTSAQNRLLDILFIYCKMNTDVSYRQGMHELLAPILWVVDNESLSSTNGYTMVNVEDATIRQALSADYVEHDTFALFSSLMKSAKVYYEYNDEVFNRRPVKRAGQSSDVNYARLIKEVQAEAAKLTPVVMKCNKIHDEYLRTIDLELYNHLKDLEIEPQLYGIRWIRLLFGREFPLNQVLILWDGMFAEDPTLRVVDFVCVALMLRIRDELLESDYAGCLSMLMRFPSINDVEVLVPQAIYLRDHLSSEGGNYIIQQNAIRLRKPTIPIQIPVQREREPNHIEGLVPDGFVHVTKNSAVILNKAILSAVGEVKKNVLRRPDGQYDHKKRQSTSDFPQRYAHSYQHTVHETESHQNSEDILKLKEQNRQMGIVVQRSINILEQEILVKTKSKEEVNAVDADKIEKNSDGTTSRSSFEYIAGNNNEEPNIPTSNEISILNVLHGLKHVRDVLNGSVKEFNPHILELTNNNAEDHDHWEVVDDGVSVVSMAGTEDETASVTKEVQTKQEKIVPTVNASKAPISESTPKKDVETPQSSSPPFSSFSSPLTDETSSQSTSLQQSNPLADQIKISDSVDEKPNLISTTQSRSSPRGVKPTSISLPKSKVKLNHADKRSVGTPKSSIASNSKYSWIVEGCTEDDDNSLFNPKRSSNVGISGLSSYSSERMNYGYLDRSIEDEDQFKKSNLTQRRSKNTERNRSESIGSVSSTNNLKKANNNVTPEIPVEDPLGSKEEVNAVDADKIEKNSDGTTSRSSFEYIAGNNNEEPNIPTSNEISILNVLHGLKHVRDVLNGSVKEFNPHILELTNNNAEDHDHWEVVDDGVSVVSMAGTEDETASVTKEVQTKQEKIVPTVNASKAPISESTPKKDVETPQSSSPPFSSFSSPLTDETSSQSTSLQQSNPLADQIKISDSVDEKPNLISTTQSRSSPRGVKPTSISLPKSKVKLNHADKRSVGTPKSSIASNSKYSWIVEGCTEDDDNSLFNPKRSSNVGISGLSSYSSERMNYGYLDRSIEDEDQFKKSNLTQRRSKNTERNRSESIGSVSSTNNLKKANNNVTPEIPVEDPLGVL
ncbi:31389_t:CDS:10 [Racocetra persica]|uniref:31389_t:CDS:1 n=1 Tax=Racocetra persica TaxID=160502 RepID=A0ACA9LFK2_9GLOM|nr:31389_t:CDS:10 [Racocetra persica]